MNTSARRGSSLPLPMIVLGDTNGGTKKSVDSEDERELIEGVQEQYGEYCGRINASRCESHPFIRSIFMFQLFLGLFGTLIAVQPAFIYMSADGAAMQIALFIIELLLAAVVSITAHELRMEEMLLLVRCRGYGEATKLSIHTPVSMAFFALCLLAQLLANMVAARKGDLGPWVHVLLALACSIFIFIAVLFAQRQRNHYIVNDL